MILYLFTKALKSFHIKKEEVHKAKDISNLIFTIYIFYVLSYILSVLKILTQIILLAILWGTYNLYNFHLEMRKQTQRLRRGTKRLIKINSKSKI